MFQACVAVNVEIGDMFLRITQKCEFVPALVALRCADKRVFARVLLFSVPCRSQRCHDISRIGSSQKVIRTVFHAYVVHLLNSSSWVMWRLKVRAFLQVAWWTSLNYHYRWASAGPPVVPSQCRTSCSVKNCRHCEVNLSLIGSTRKSFLAKETKRFTMPTLTIGAFLAAISRGC